jgi:putative oxidoreductase
MLDRVSVYTPQALAVLRIVTGVLFVHAGMTVLFNLPPPMQAPPPGMETLMTIAGVIEFVGGLLILVGFLTRPVAFVLCGFMAAAYWGFHFPMDPFPNNNFGVPAILYCFIFLYLFFAGPGAWSIDTVREGAAA